MPCPFAIQPFVPGADFTHRNKGLSLDYLVGKRDHRGRNLQRERSRGLEVNCQIKARRLQDWQVRWLVALENATHIDASAAEGVSKIRVIAHQAAGGDELSQRIRCWNPVARC